MEKDVRTMLKAAGWYYDAPNSTPGAEVWKYAGGSGGEVKLYGQLVAYMEGPLHLLQRTAAYLDLDGISFGTQEERKWVRWHRP